MKVDVHDRLEAVGRAAWEDLLARGEVSSPFLSFADDRRGPDGAGRRVAIRDQTRFGCLRCARDTSEFGPTPDDVYQVRIT